MTRYIPAAHVDEVIRLWHLARVALSHYTFSERTGRYDRLQWTVSEYVKAHPEWSARRTAVYKDIETLVRP